MKPRAVPPANFSERGQAIIFLAIVIPVVALVMGLAVEMGRAVVTYRQMQAAADMAALVGAQDLPEAPSTAQSDACSYVQNNGFDSCTAGGTTTNGTSTTVVCIPPASNSPYSFISYGGNKDCSSPTSSNYIEVQITNDIGVIPVFNTGLTLSVKAVARNGIPGVFDYAIAALDPTSGNKGGITFGGSHGLITNGSVISNSTNGNSITNPGNGQVITCNGKYYNAAAETEASAGGLGFHSFNLGSTQAALGAAPPSCDGFTTASPSFSGEDSPVQYFPSSPAIADSYASTQAPSATNMAIGCSLCAHPASTTYYLDRKANQWVQSSAKAPQLSGSGGFLELWPGTYSSITVHGGIVVLNPGVYTITSGGVDINGGAVCIYGAPVCDEALSSQKISVTSVEPSFTTPSGDDYIPGTSANCSNAQFGSTTGGTTVTSGNWYYWCSTWGLWDSSNHGLTLPSGWSNDTAPQFINPKTGTTTTPSGEQEPYINGVTFYLQGASTGNTTQNNFSAQGNGDMFLAAPNPCAGTGTSGTNSIDFPNGAPTTAARSTYLTITDGVSVSGADIYPNADLTSSGDCSNPGEVWAGEFGAPNGASTPPYSDSQHLHFLIFAQNGGNSTTDGSSITLTGTSGEIWQGILHTFPPACYYTGESTDTHCTDSASTSYTDPPVNNCVACLVKVGGTSGGALGPPMLYGQIVGNAVTFNGSMIAEVFNRPGGKDTRPGSSLIQ